MKPSDGKVLLSEDTAGIGEVGQAGNVENDNLKLVPLSESVRYRKRAQSAEKKIEDLVKQLAEAKAETKTTAEQLRQVQVEQKLVHKLTAAGTVDLDTAMLIAKTRMEGETEADMDSVIKRLRKEKQYLFAGAGGTTGTKRTAGAKERTEGGQVVLERAAKRAATTGSRADLQEYLKLRRNFI